ncbi:helix-turn-helix transcriptional regulator [uncultured Jannaschia sp.]|uniref:helix-turn-helix transcriptional regulator n=1 Tax=uncultured Jannaschia sp. TaxID=293347 RepID=UPI0026194724|nr:helix-turn-helix transcriptional regulator [uncultured Jannaschia sp.]
MDSDALYAQIGNKISAARRDAGLTQNAVARQVGVSRASLANIEAGRQQVFVHHLVKIAHALELCDISALLHYDLNGQDHGLRAEDVRFSGADLSMEEREGVLAFLSRAASKDRHGDDAQPVR